jgi:hypothetical protein
VNLPSLSHVSLARISDQVKATITTILAMAPLTPRESDAVAGPSGAMGEPSDGLTR